MELTVSSESGNMTSFQAKLYSPWFSVHHTAILSASTWNQKIIYHVFIGKQIGLF